MTLEYGQARLVADEFIDLIRDHCARVEVVGSIRRKRPVVHDIDIVAMPVDRKIAQRTWFGDVWKSMPTLHAEIDDLLRAGVLEKVVKKDGHTMVGDTIAMVEYKGVHVDLYYATPETWGGLMLVRTGSVEHNIVMTSRAKERGWILKADGTGVWDSRPQPKPRLQKPGMDVYAVGDRPLPKRIDDGTEEGIFKVLGVPYREPPLREVPK